MTSILENQESQPRHSALRPQRILELDANHHLLVQEVTPCPDPVDCFRRLVALPRSLFLDSALKRDGLGRYSFLTADPFRFIEVHDEQIWIDGSPCSLAAGTTPLDVLRS